jgi:hypothetical protein
MYAELYHSIILSPWFPSCLILFPEEGVVHSYEMTTNSYQTTRHHISDENNYNTSDTIMAFFPLST